MADRIFRYIKKIGVLILLYTIMFLIIFFSKELSAGIKNGINISLNLIIPSMFIFMIFSNVIINSNLKSVISKPFTLLSKYILKITRDESAIVILSLLGGYPIGARLLSSAVANKTMTAKRAEHLLCYCVNCGPAFLISGIGVGLFSNLTIGLYIYISQIVACLLTGFLLSFFYKRSSKDRLPAKESNIPISASLVVSSVNDSVKSLCVICGFIVAFSSIMPIVTIMLDNMGFKYGYILQGFLEVSSGCSSIAKLNLDNAVLLATLFTAFGGICVHLQIYTMISSAKIKMTKFYISRVLYVATSVITVKALFIISPQTANCMSYNTNTPSDIYSVSPTATVFMILLAIILLFFTRKSDRIKTKNML